MKISRPVSFLASAMMRSEEHTSELQSQSNLVCRLLLEQKKPLAGIKWMLELAAQTPQVPAEAGSYVADARAVAERLIGLVNDLLDMSRLDSGKLPVTLQ